MGPEPTSKNGEHRKRIGRGEGARAGGREETKGSEPSWMGRSTHLEWKVEVWRLLAGEEGEERLTQGKENFTGPQPWQTPPIQPSITLQQRFPLSGI